MNQVPKLSKNEAAIIGLYTGFTCGPFSDIHEKAEVVLGHAIWTHEFASKELMAELKGLVKAEYVHASSGLTKEQAAIIWAYTGVPCGDVTAFLEKASSLLGYEVCTRDLEDIEFWETVKEKVKSEFLAICAD